MTRCTLLFLTITACGPAERPFEGPGFDAESGVTTTAEGPFFAVVTHAGVAKGQVKDFEAHVAAIMTQLDEGQSGYVGSSLRGQGLDRWTLTVWEDEESLGAFAFGEVHLAAMAETGTLTDVSRSTSWTIQPDAMPPSWDDALDKLDADRPL